MYTCFLPPIRYSQTMVFKDVCITKTPYSKVWNKHKPYVYIFFKFLFQALRSYLCLIKFWNFVHGLRISSSFLFLFKALHSIFFAKYPNPTFIQGPMFIRFVKISRPYFYFLPYVYFRL